MYTYTNSFRGATNVSRSELTLEFMQNIPEFGIEKESTTVVGTKDEVIASIVMSAECAVALRNMLNKAIDDFANNSSEEIVD